MTIKVPYTNHIKKNKIFVSIAGSYWTGSSALLDLLVDNPNFYSPPGEFSLFSYGQFFNDVVNPIFKKDNINPKIFNENILRFTEFNKDENINIFPYRKLLRRILRIINFHPKGINSIRAGYNRIMSEEYELLCSNLVEALSKKKKFNDKEIQILKETILSLLGSIGTIKNYSNPTFILLDQFISPSYVEQSLKLSPDLKMIFVDRDWRDQYSEVKSIFPSMMKKNMQLNVFPMGEKQDDYLLKPIDFFIKLRNKVSHYKRVHKERFHKEVLWLEFEDLVFKPENSLKEVFRFLNISNNFTINTDISIMEKSKKNIGKWHNFDIDNDISYINERIQ